MVATSKMRKAHDRMCAARPYVRRIRAIAGHLAEATAIRGRDLDEASANEARRQAEEALRSRDTRIDYAKAQSELAIAIAQIQALSRQKKRH